MAHDSTLNPTIIGGRQSRFAVKSVACRNFRTDQTAERHLTTLGQYLAGELIEDRPSISLILRRSVAVYREHLEALLASPAGLDYERVRVREGSKLPRRKKPPL